MRVYALYLLVAFLSVYAYRHWFRSLCGLILLMAVIEHPDMPKNIMGIQGLNPWNIVLVNVLVGWLINRRREGLVWDMPRPLNVLLVLYLLIVLVGSLRMFGDRTHLEMFTTAELISENLINTVKWAIPGLLVFDGCRSRRQLLWGLTSILVMYFLLTVQVIRWMPPSATLTADSLTSRAGKIIQNEVGYHRVNMSMMLAGASWAIFSVASSTKRRMHSGLLFAAALLVAYAQALTAGRMGYLTWGAVGLTLCLLRWRKYLVLLPVVVVVIGLAVPGAVERALRGFGETDVTGEVYIDDYEVTAGRTLMWPIVIDKIGESPLVGYGRQAMVRTGLRDHIRNQYGDGFRHPHNAYLEWLLDNGMVGFLCVIPFYVIVVVQAGRLFVDRRSPWCTAVGGVALSLVLALLIASMGSQTFYPREGAVGMWAAIGLMLRVWQGLSTRGSDVQRFLNPRTAPFGNR
ncbi:MAG: O-antigen ligase family protein [Phycisphaerae bacterium]